MPREEQTRFVPDFNLVEQFEKRRRKQKLQQRQLVTRPVTKRMVLMLLLIMLFPLDIYGLIADYKTYTPVQPTIWPVPTTKTEPDLLRHAPTFRSQP